MKIKFTDDFKEFVKDSSIKFTFDLEGTYKVVKEDGFGGVTFICEGEEEKLPHQGYEFVDDDND